MNFWELPDGTGDLARLERTPGHKTDLYLRASGYLTPAAARSLRDALNAYLDETSTAEGWELP